MVRDSRNQKDSWSKIRVRCRVSSSNGFCGTRAVHRITRHLSPSPRNPDMHCRSYASRDCGIPDLMIDRHPDTQKPYCFMSLNFHKTYPAVISGLRLSMNDERFDVPQADLTNVFLADAFSWAYAYFIREAQSPGS